MPHSGYTICTSEQLPTSTTVSHGFVVEWYSSPPFGSHGPRKHSKPCPLDCGSGDSMQHRRMMTTSAPPHSRRESCLVAFTKHCGLSRHQGKPSNSGELHRLLGPCFKTGRERHREGIAKLCCQFLTVTPLGGGEPRAVTTMPGWCSPRTGAHPGRSRGITGD